MPETHACCSSLLCVCENCTLKIFSAPFGHEGLEAEVAADLSVRVFIKFGDTSAPSPDCCPRAHDLIIFVLTTAVVVRRGAVASR